ncbi:hypothetical protein SVIOM74S_01488 [Streptomyces violarus]
MRVNRILLYLRPGRRRPGDPACASSPASSCRAPCPDLLLLTVLGLALVYGPCRAAPSSGSARACSRTSRRPPTTPPGRYALVLCVIGYLAGLVKPENGPAEVGDRPHGRGRRRRDRLDPAVRGRRRARRRHRRPPCGPGQPAVHGRGLRPPVPFAVPLVMALARRTENDPLAETSSAPTTTSPPARLRGTGLRIGNQRERPAGSSGPPRAARAGRIKGSAPVTAGSSPERAHRGRRLRGPSFLLVSAPHLPETPPYPQPYPHREGEAPQ